MLLALAAVPVARCTREYFTVDACLDSGGAWIEQIDKCSHDQAELDRYKPR
ncbi:MAG TPA: hypothetical protein PLH31_02125 [Caulobacter sp.]|nr:hypothetical protein [Caulobacter sp.]